MLKSKEIDELIRFPNPGSDISNIIRIFCEIFEALNSQGSFSIGDISSTLARRNFATSCGFTGEEALARSAREDRSLDPLYNQSKMYSELFRILGWIHSLDHRLNFQFTYFGAHVVAAKLNPSAVFEQSALGIVYPNEVLKVKGDYQLRPFATFLRTLRALDGLLARDELIVGPMCLSNDRDDKLFNNMIEDIRNFRRESQLLNDRIRTLEDQRRIRLNTMRNYTRFPLAVLRWAGWTESETNKVIYDKSMKFEKLTDKGYKVLELIDRTKDIRGTDLEGIDRKIKEAIVRLGFYQTLERASFDIDFVEATLIEDKVLVENYFNSLDCSILFSPFQELHSDYLYSVFPHLSTPKASETPTEFDVSRSHSTTAEMLYSSVELDKAAYLIETTTSDYQGIEGEILGLFKESVEKGWEAGPAIEAIMSQYAQANKDTFYPVVEMLFKAIGYDCELSQPGVNYKRWDAMIKSTEHSMPIEIKSPGEEKALSIKAIRQALENKVVLLARSAYPTEFQDTSLAVCYSFPNDRSEVNSLINAVFEVYGITIGVIDFSTLLQIAWSHFKIKKEHNKEQLEKLRGFIRLSDT